MEIKRKNIALDNQLQNRIQELKVILKNGGEIQNFQLFLDNVKELVILFILVKIYQNIILDFYLKEMKLNLKDKNFIDLI